MKEEKGRGEGAQGAYALKIRNLIMLHALLKILSGCC